MLDQLGNGLMLGVIIAVSAVGLSLLYGVTKIVNFAHGELLALGAISTLFFSSPETSRVLYLDRFSPLGLDFGLSVFFAILLCGITGGLLELLLFRPLRKAEVGNIAVLVVTIGLSILTRHLYLLFTTGKVQKFPLDLQRRETYLFIDLNFSTNLNDPYLIKKFVNLCKKANKLDFVLKYKQKITFKHDLDPTNKWLISTYFYLC